MAISISLSIALLMKLPFSNAIDDAPNLLYVIYQASVTFFAALITFQILFRQTNSAFDVFIKAIDVKLSEDEKKHPAPNQGITLNNPVEDKSKTWP